MALLFMALLLCCSAFFSGTETALFSLSPEQIKKLRSHGHHVERMLHQLAENPTGLLIAILFGNLVVNILFFCISAVLTLHIGQRYGGWWQAVASAGVLFVVILVGEILPKAVGISFPEQVVRLNAMPLWSWFRVMGPVRGGLELVVNRLEPSSQHDNRLDSEELKMLIEATRHDSTFGKQEKAIVEDIVNLPEIRVRELMVPRVEQLFRRKDALVGETLAEVAEREMELIPIYEEAEDNIVGVVDARVTVCVRFARPPFVRLCKSYWIRSRNQAG